MRSSATFPRLWPRLVFAWAVLLVFAHTAVQACPGCKQNLVLGPDGKVPPMTGASIGFSLSIYFLLFVVASALGSLGYMMYRSCRVLAARDAALMAAEEAA